MNWASSIRLFDSYNRIARLYPALLAMVPALLLAAAAYPAWLSLDLPKGAAFLVIVSCLLYFLASIARSRGKNLEPLLIAKWGGWPSTVILRRSDTTLDPYTKERYYAELERLGQDIRLPTVDEENQSPLEADTLYRSATKRLIEARRGVQYKILHAENASYGFRRNMLGLKPIAVTIAISSAAIAIVVWLLKAHATKLTFAVLVAMVSTDWQMPLLSALDLAYAVVLLVVVREPFVLQAAREYAGALLNTLDEPQT